MSLTFRYYPNEYPYVDEVVMTRIIEENEFGYKVVLMEYNDIEGLAQLSEVVRGGRRRKKKPFKIGDTMPMLVLRVNLEKGSIDLSKRKVPQSEVEPFRQRFRSYGRMNQLGLEIHSLYHKFCQDAGIEPDDGVEKIMELTVWKHFDKDEGDIDKIWFDLFQDPSVILKDTDLPKKFVDQYIQNLESRVTRTDSLLEQEIVIRSCEENGVQVIKELLDLKHDKDDYTLIVTVVSPPIYKVRVEGPDMVECEKILKGSIETLKQTAKERSATFMPKGEVQMIRDRELDFHFLGNFDFDRFIFEI